VGVTLSISGSVRSPEDREEILRWIDGRAADLEWNRRPVRLAFERARLGSGPAAAPLSVPRATGTSLLPHFACEEIPLVFLDQDGTLVDEVVEQDAAGVATFLAGALVKTQFAGPAVHREICGVLRDLRRLAGIAVDDESGFAETGDEAGLERAFSDAWAGIRSQLAADRAPAGSRIGIGGFLVEVRESPLGDEFASVSAEQRRWILAGERACMGRFSGFGTTLDRSRESVLDLELAISDVDDRGWRRDPVNPEVEDLAIAAGACFGRTLAAVLGGAWIAEDDQLALADVGGCGLIVDPFQVARDRILRGPPHGFTHHLDVYATFARELARDREP
jgi:hypothetical protein